MRTWTLVLGLALVLLAACDRGVSLYESSAAMEQQGDLEGARQSYLTVFQQFPASKKAADAKLAYVRLSLDLAEKSIAAGELKDAESRLGEAQPQMEGDGNRERFLKVKAALRDTAMAAHEGEAVKALFDHVKTLAATPGAAREVAGPGMTPAMLARVHLGKDGAVERSGFNLGKVSRVGSGQFVASVEVATSAGAQQDEWYVQNTTNGWRVLCVQATGGTDCKDPWAYKNIDAK